MINNDSTCFGYYEKGEKAFCRVFEEKLSVVKKIDCSKCRFRKTILQCAEERAAVIERLRELYENPDTHDRAKKIIKKYNINLYENSEQRESDIKDVIMRASYEK